MGHDIDPEYRADIVIMPPLRSMLLISYWGRPKTISESVKRILPRMFYHLGIQGLPPFLIKIQKIKVRPTHINTPISFNPIRLLVARDRYRSAAELQVRAYRSAFRRLSVFRVSGAEPVSLCANDDARQRERRIRPEIFLPEITGNFDWVRPLPVDVTVAHEIEVHNHNCKIILRLAYFSTEG